MKSRLPWILMLPLALLWYGAATTGSAVPVLPAVPALEPPPAGEVARIQAHLAAVERELLARDVSHLSAGQRAERERHIRVLREYRERGVFPHNHDFPDRRVPYFVDDHGTLCAMAYLISRSGRDDLVERVAATRNNAYVPELAGDPALVAWLHAAGLSAEEAARIQPTYGGPCCSSAPTGDADGASAGFALASTLVSAVGGATVGVNVLSAGSADGPRWPGVLGLAAGATGIALGVDRMGDSRAPAWLGLTTAGIGMISASVGAWTLVRSPGDGATERVAGPAGAAAASVSIAPLVVAEQGGGAGVVLRMAF